MPTNNFFLELNASNRAVIRQHDSDLAITIFRLQQEPFQTRADKFQLFGEIHGVPVAFQCALVDFSFETEVIAAALQWYATRMNYPQMAAGMMDPRPALN